MIHDGHQDLVKCRDRGNQSVWWPNVSSNIVTKVQQCKCCREDKSAQRKEALMPRPMEKIAIDLCEFKKQNYLVVSDYYSRYREILNLPSIASSQVTAKLKATFARHRVLEIPFSDNAANPVSEMGSFAKIMILSM